MTAPGEGTARAIATRFGILLGAVYAFPFPLGELPGTVWIGEQLGKPVEWFTGWLGTRILALPAPPEGPNGSGDRTYNYVGLLAIVILAVIGTIVWSALDRRRTRYPRLLAALRVWLRYLLAATMFSYGFSKVLKSQFPDLHLARLAQPVGELPPMALLWTFMGYSTPYTVFAGLAEVVGGVLLLWRRTTAIGALVIAAVMTNVVMLNFCYDVPVKLYSSTLLVIALVIAAPQLRRLIAAAMGYATAEQPARPRWSARWERARWIAKLVVIAGLAWQLYDEFSHRKSRNAHVHELYGAWEVDHFLADGVEHPPLTTDAARWRLVAANPTRLVIHPMTGVRELLSLKVDVAHATITVDLDDDRDQARNEARATGGKPAAPDQEIWHYTRPAPDRLVIDGIHRGVYVHVSLHLAPPAPLLTRGFHWINEEPRNESRFNR